MCFNIAFDQINDTMSQNLIQENIAKDIARAITRGLPDKEKLVPLLGSWPSFQKQTTIENMKTPKSITCQQFAKV